MNAPVAAQVGMGLEMKAHSDSALPPSGRPSVQSSVKVAENTSRLDPRSTSDLEQLAAIISITFETALGQNLVVLTTAPVAGLSQPLGGFPHAVPMEYISGGEWRLLLPRDAGALRYRYGLLDESSGLVSVEAGAPRTLDGGARCAHVCRHVCRHV